MADSPAFANIPRASAATVVTGDTSRSAPATFVTVLTPGQNGSRIERLSFAGLGATIQSVIRLFLHDGAAFHLYQEITVGPVATPSATQLVWQGSMEAVTTPNLMPLLVPAGWTLRASINDTQAGGGVKITATGGDF